MSNGAIKGLSLLFVGSISWYAGVKFWQPLIVEQLKKDGNLRDDIDIPEGEKHPESWADIRAGIRAAIHPDQEAKRNDKFEQDLKETVDDINEIRNQGKK